MKKFSRYAKNRFNSLANHLAKFGDDPRPELLHRIRLEIKKIKVLLHVTEFCIAEFNGHKHYLPFRSVFRKAGEIRQGEVLNELFRFYKIDLEGIDEKKLLADRRKLISSFQKELPRLLLAIEMKREILMRLFKTIKRSCFEKYAYLKEKELQKMVFPRLNQRKLHQTRKVIKEIICLSTIAGNSQKEVHSVYDKLQIMIGLWHDKQIVATVLKTNKYHGEGKILKTECRNDIKNIRELINQFYH